MTTKRELDERMLELERSLATVTEGLATLQVRTVANLTRLVDAVGSLTNALTMLNVATMRESSNADTADEHALVAQTIDETFEAIKTMIEAWQAETGSGVQGQGKKSRSRRGDGGRKA